MFPVFFSFLPLSDEQDDDEEEQEEKCQWFLLLSKSWFPELKKGKEN